MATSWNTPAKRFSSQPPPSATTSPASNVSTPLEETFSFPLQDAIVFTGSADPWVEAGRIPSLCKESGILCFVIPDANHSLETADPEQDILTLQKIMFETEQYMAK